MTVGTLISASTRLLPNAITLLKARLPGCWSACAKAPPRICSRRWPRANWISLSDACPSPSYPGQHACAEPPCALLRKRCAWSSARATEWGGPRHPPGPTDRRVVDPAHAGLAGALGGRAPVSRGRPAAAHGHRRIAVDPDQHWSVAARPVCGADASHGRPAVLGRGPASHPDLPEMGAFGTVGYTLRLHREPSAACRTFIACLRDAAPHGSDAAIERAIEALCPPPQAAVATGSAQP